MAATDVVLVDVRGTPRECGRGYGEAAREPINLAVAYYKEAFARSTGLAWDAICDRVRNWVPLIESYYPDALVEMAGIAEGAGLRFEEILAVNARGELLSGSKGPEDDSGAGSRDEEGCTSFALLPEATGDRHVYCGQNWDWLSGVATTLVVARIAQPGRPTVVMQLEAGQVGRHGASSAGIALNANGLGGGFPGATGVPATVVRRKVLASWTMYEALSAIFKVRQGYVTNLLVTHRDGFSIDLETTPGRNGWMYPEDGVLVHGNHFMSFVPAPFEGNYRPYSVDSLYRVPRLRDGLARCREVPTSDGVVKQIAESLRDHFGHPDSLCNHARGEGDDSYQTIASSVVDLTAGEYRLASGLPCENEHELLPWNLYDGPGVPDGARPLATA